MVFLCCCSLAIGIRVAGLVSALLGLAVCGVSGWLFWEAYEERERFKQQILAGEFVTNLLNTFGVKEKIDFVKLNRIKLACYGVAFVSAELQILTSLLILVCPAAKCAKFTAKIYCVINPFVLIALLGACGCFVSDGTGIDYKGDLNILNFLGVSLLDSVFLFYFLCVTGAFIRS